MIKYTKENGISLISLVITIIVMLIISTAVILSLLNNGIIGKANKAKIDNDKASLTEYIELLKTEWNSILESEDKTSCAEYVNNNLDKNGYTYAVLSEDGEIYFGLNENVRNAIKAGLKLGDAIEYKIDFRERETSGNEYNGTKQLIQNEVNFIWRYKGLNENGEIEILPDLTPDSPKIILSGKGGYLYGPYELNNICDKLYTVENVGKARSIKMEDVLKLLEYTPSKGGYYDGNNKYTKTEEALTIQEIIDKNKENEINVETPDGNDVGTYKADYYYIYKTNKNLTSNEIKKNLVYPESFEKGKDAYWLANTCNYVNFKYKYVYNSVFIVYTHIINASSVFLSNKGVAHRNFILRPIVTIDTNIKLEFNKDKLIWTLDL